ncbi:hypothetical protein E2C01_012714 [Portunus trituberculatus]|uniref:Uncharacterized protein n=1 Tax=Portunus trituberculatus TaxID=210409 RepID=A0A5B7DES0_PORTR|nr:hypothetical protein [Portunus trituberculatus]
MPEVPPLLGILRRDWRNMTRYKYEIVIRGAQRRKESNSISRRIRVSQPQPQQQRAEVVTHHSRRPEDLCSASSSRSKDLKQPQRKEFSQWPMALRQLGCTSML